jgi:hypothetical protein
MRQKRPELHMNPKTPKPPRNTNLVIRIANITKSLEIRQKLSKNRSKQMRTPKPMNTGRTVSRDVKG